MFSVRTVATGAISGILLAACSHDAPPANKTRTVLVQTAQTANQNSLSVLTGEVRARHEVDLAFRVGGKIAARLVDAGAEVKAGAPLARLDPADLQLAQQSARAQLAAAESDAATAQAERERYADLLSKKFVSQALFDAKDNAAKAAKARNEQARAQASVSGNQVGYGSLSSDQAGVITAVLADAGQVVAAGQPVMRLARPEEKEIAVVVPESRFAELKNAKEIVVGFWALPDVRVKGALRELSPAADPMTRTYAARIRLIDPPPSVQLGMTARVGVGSSLADAPVVVPLSAVVDQGQGPAVWVAADNKAVRRPIEVKQFREDGVLLSKGLQPGELVIVTGANRLVADQAVKPEMLNTAAAQEAKK